jgi:hypothetical protein
MVPRDESGVDLGAGTVAARESGHGVLFMVPKLSEVQRRAAEDVARVQQDDKYFHRDDDDDGGGL